MSVIITIATPATKASTRKQADAKCLGKRPKIGRLNASQDSDCMTYSVMAFSGASAGKAPELNGMAQPRACLDRIHIGYCDCPVERIPLPIRHRPGHHHRTGGEAIPSLGVPDCSVWTQSVVGADAKCHCECPEISGQSPSGAFIK